MIALTHFGHSCVLVEAALPVGTVRILFDPGSYATGFEDIRGLNAVLITHAHPDHLDLKRLPALMKANPGAELLVDSGSARHVGQAGLACREVTGGDTVTTMPVLIHVVGGDHAVIHEQLPNIANNGYAIEDVVFHPGDSFMFPPYPVRVLLLPTGGPWMKIGEGIDYLRHVAPDVVVPIHQAGLASIHQELHYQLLRELAPERCRVEVLQSGVSRIV